MLKIKIPKANWFKELLPVSKLDNIANKKKELTFLKQMKTYSLDITLKVLTHKINKIKDL